MRVPLRTETDAFRVAIALGLLAAASIVLGVLSTQAYGIVLFAAGVAAGVTFELSGRTAESGAVLREASRAPHPHGATDGKRHILVIAEAELAGEQLATQLVENGVAGVELDILSPIMASRSHHWTSDVDRERSEAEQRLDASLAWARGQGFTARGEVGDVDPLAAVEDELRDFGADEIVLVTHPRERTSWLAQRMLSHLTRELEIPVREIVIPDRAATEGEGHAQ